ncbi:succinate dehydrogenase, cytochrome b556 subunit [Thermoflexus sp.]|uniref:succinate dehydrogenase, cytochrome b556 subunit n=1 Tax=Thermoflexus sp. TaxID=1969742 RepID=UPI0035E409A7
MASSDVIIPEETRKRWRALEWAWVPGAGLRLVLQEIPQYRGRIHQWAWVANRIAGLGTLLFLTIHILDTSLVYFAPTWYEHAIALYRHPLFSLGELILVGCVLWHGLNGLRIAISDFRPRLWAAEIQARMILWTIVVFLVLYIPTFFIMGNVILQKGILGR